MSHIVRKPFHAAEVNRVVQPGEAFVPTDPSRAGELERGGLVEKIKVRVKPDTKDAAPQRKVK
jgi:hypothetical protein